MTTKRYGNKYEFNDNIDNIDFSINLQNDDIDDIFDYMSKNVVMIEEKKKDTPIINKKRESIRIKQKKRKRKDTPIINKKQKKRKDTPIITKKEETNNKCGCCYEIKSKLILSYGSSVRICNKCTLTFRRRVIHNKKPMNDIEKRQFELMDKTLIRLEKNKKKKKNNICACCLKNVCIAKRKFGSSEKICRYCVICFEIKVNNNENPETEIEKRQFKFMKKKLVKINKKKINISKCECCYEKVNITRHSYGSNKKICEHCAYRFREIVLNGNTPKNKLDKRRFSLMNKELIGLGLVRKPKYKCACCEKKKSIVVCSYGSLVKICKACSRVFREKVRKNESPVTDIDIRKFQLMNKALVDKGIHLK